MDTRLRTRRELCAGRPLGEWTWRRSIAATVGACAVAGFALCADMRAADRPALPPSVVYTVDGAPLTLNQQFNTGRWLVVYVTPDSPASSRLADALKAWQLPSTEHIAFVVGGNKTAAEAFARAHESIGVNWALDGDKAAWTDLHVTGVPTLLGVDAGLIAWRLAGVLNDPSAMQSVITSWIGGPSQSPRP